MATLSDYQRDILVKTALSEARGEGVEGMSDVIQVILNRANSGRYPSDPAAVALQPKQFSGWNKGEGGNNPNQFKKGTAEYKRAEEALDAVISGNRPDYTGGALFYHTPAVNPSWAGEVNRYGTVNRNGHVFYPNRPIPPGEIPNVVATQTDTRRPITPSMPTAMSPQLAAQRNLASMLGSGQFTAPGSEYASAYTSTPRSSAENAIAQALTGGQTSRPSASFYNGIFAQQPATARDVANVPYNGGSTVGTISTQPPLTAPRQIDNSVNNARMGQDPATAAALARYISQPPPSRNTAPSPSRSAIRADNGQTGPAYTPPRAPAVIPAQNGRTLQRQEQTQRLQPRISTVASIPTTPQRTALPPVAPSPVASPRMISTSMERAAAAQDPRLAAALAAPRSTPAQPTAAQRAALAYVPPATQSRIGQPPATRVVPSVPVPGPMNGVGSPLPTWDDFQRQFAPPTPGPNNPMVKSQDRLTAGVYPRAPIGPELPGVASALSVIAPRQPSAFPTSASLRPMSVQGYPTPVSQRPAPTGLLRSAFGIPTPAAMRPQPPLAVTVTGARTIVPPRVVQSAPTRINPSNHNAAQLAAAASGRSTFSRSPGAVSEPVRAMNGKLRYTY